MFYFRSHTRLYPGTVRDESGIENEKNGTEFLFLPATRFVLCGS